MGIKKTLGLGVASAALGLSLIGGGTFAYFSDTAQSTATFAAGTLDLNSDPSVIVDLKDLKPGDTIKRDFKLKNDGTLDIGSVLLKTSTFINDVGGNNGANDLASSIKVKFLVNKDKSGILPGSEEKVVWETTLAALKSQTPDLVKNTGLDAIWGTSEATGIKAGTNDGFTVQFEFVDNGQEQNYYQKDSLTLTWEFVGKQTDGSAK